MIPANAFICLLLIKLYLLLATLLATVDKWLLTSHRSFPKCLFAGKVLCTYSCTWSMLPCILREYVPLLYRNLLQNILQGLNSVSSQKEVTVRDFESHMWSLYAVLMSLLTTIVPGDSFECIPASKLQVPDRSLFSVVWKLPQQSWYSLPVLVAVFMHNLWYAPLDQMLVKQTGN